MDANILHLATFLDQYHGLLIKIIAFIHLHLFAILLIIPEFSEGRLENLKLTRRALKAYHRRRGNERTLIALNHFIFDITSSNELFGFGLFKNLGGIDITTYFNGFGTDVVNKWSARFLDRYPLVGELISDDEDYGEESSDESDNDDRYQRWLKARMRI